MAVGALKLADRLAVPIETEPFEPVENRVHRALRRPFPVGVFDAQQERAAEALGVEPVEQRRARASDMQEAGRRGREAGDDGHGSQLDGRKTEPSARVYQKEASSAKERAVLRCLCCARRKT